jgi:hypothetical protein
MNSGQPWSLAPIFTPWGHKYLWPLFDPLFYCFQFTLCFFRSMLMAHK